jgi:hypothetical protein
LRSQYEAIQFKDGETVEDFAHCLHALVIDLRDMGGTLTNEHMLKKLLRVVPFHYRQLALSIEQMLNLKTMPLEELAGHLVTIKSYKPVSASSKALGGLVLLSEQEWTARMKNKEPQKKQWHGKRGGQGGSGEGGSSKDGGAPAALHDKSIVCCFNCDNYGHYAKECRKLRRERRQEAHVAEAQEESVLLLMTASAMVTTAAPGTIVLDEPHAQLQVGHHEELSPDRWFLDTGASNHMSGRREFFTDLDDSVRGVVCFGDGSVINICGFGDVTLECYNGAHRIVFGVYYIPKLKSNLISLSQLNENGCVIHIEDGVMTIRDRARALVAKVLRTEGRSYLLDLKVAQPVCLAASCVEVSWLWHARYGHLNFGSLRRLAQGAMVRVCLTSNKWIASAIAVKSRSSDVHHSHRR